MKPVLCAIVAAALVAGCQEDRQDAAPPQPRDDRLSRIIESNDIVHRAYWSQRISLWVFVYDRPKNWDSIARLWCRISSIHDVNHRFYLTVWSASGKRKLAKATCN